VMFLCSEEARFMTGSILDCSGGGHINRRAGAATAARG
jgi:3-oxoacyl-[acyl-carrier protein] reductase